MDLKDFLQDVFPKQDEENYTKMIDNLKRLGFDSSSSLKYLDEEAIKELTSFSRIEIKRLTDYLSKYEFETLEEVLNDIFAGIPRERIKNINNFLNKLEIYLRRDILAIDTEKPRIKDFFSESELMRIESFLEKHNRDHYNKIMTKREFHTSDLIIALNEIFNGTDMNRISEIEEILRKQNINAKKDLIYIDMDKFKKEKILLDIEVLKIKDFLEENHNEQYHKIKIMKETEKSKELKHVLREIFLGTSAKRLEAIEEMLRQEEIYSGEDVLITDLNSKSLRETLSSAEMSKFEEYFKKNNVDHYNKLMSDRELEKSKNLKSVLEQIFVNTPKDRLSEIENILKEEHIYSGQHVEIVDTNALRKKTSLSHTEILIIEEYIKKHNNERYNDIKQDQRKEYEYKVERLKKEDELEFIALKQKQELEFMQLKAHEEQKMIEYKAEDERLRREEEKAKEKEENEREEVKVQREKDLLEAKKQEENMRVQREKELLEAKTKEENMKIQTEKELIEARTNEENMKLQRQKELMEALAKQEMEKENMKLQREKILIEAKAKQDIEREKIEMQKKQIEMQRENEFKNRKHIENQRKISEALIKEKNGLLGDIRDLENACINLKSDVTEAENQSLVMAFFKNSDLKKKKAEAELEERKNCLKSKKERITEIDTILNSMTTF